MTGAGILKRRMTIQRATVSPNAFNEPVETWATLATVHVGRRDASAGESYKAQEVGAKISARFTIRYSAAVADVNPRDRLIHAGLVYDIVAVREKERNRWLEIDAVARPDIAAVETSP
jgi:SPP1 family predicted phage head-tail adaptor